MLRIGEHVDLSVAKSDLKKELQSQLQAAWATRFQTTETPGYNRCVTLEQYTSTHGNFLGPLCTKG